MQVTTGQSSSRTHLLFKISCLVGGVIALATFLLIWTYRGMEMDDLRDNDREIHARLATAILGSANKPGEIAPNSNPSEIAFILSRSLYGTRNSSAQLFCDDMPAEPIATGGAPFEHATHFEHPRRYLNQQHIYSEKGETTHHLSVWSANNLRAAPCHLSLVTDLTDEAQRIKSRSYQIAGSSALLEGLLLLSLLWIARRGDERLIESEKEQSAMESELFFLANYDTLTHLPNRSLFWERLDAAISRADRLGKSVCLVLVDLRGFSKINEESGRTVGDKILVEAARRIQAAARSSDLVCRLGSDEYAVLLEDLDPERAIDAANRLSIAMTRQFSESWQPISDVPIICNCGSSLYPHHGNKSEDILACAQGAVKLAKEQNLDLVFHDRHTT